MKRPVWNLSLFRIGLCAMLRSPGVSLGKQFPIVHDFVHQYRSH